MLAPHAPNPPADLPQPQVAQNPPIVPEQDEEEEAGDIEPTYSIFGGNNGGNHIIQFQTARGQYVMLNQDSVLYAHPEVRVNDCRSLTGPKFDYYQNYGQQPSIYFGAAASHAGKILPIILLKARVSLLVRDDCCLANTGYVAREPVCLKAGTNREQQLQMTRFTATSSGWPPRMRGATVFVHAPGSIVETNLGPNESMYVYTSAIVALTEGVTLQAPLTSATTGWGEEKKKEVCVVQGPGAVYISSLPVSKQARRLVDAAPSKSDLIPLVRWCLGIVLFVGLWALISP